MIGSAGALGVGSPKEATFFIISTFVSLSPFSFHPFSNISQMPVLSVPAGLRLLASYESVRAWPGGFGFAKVGANYGPTLMATREAAERGYHQVLWLLDGQVTEAGASNLFVVWRTKSGVLELVTAPLDDKIILDGVTRRSILQLARERLVKGTDGELERVEVVERKFTMEEVKDAVKEGRLVEAFAAGTAVSLPNCRIAKSDTNLLVSSSFPQSHVSVTEKKTFLSQWLLAKVENTHSWSRNG